MSKTPHTNFFYFQHLRIIKEREQKAKLKKEKEEVSLTFQISLSTFGSTKDKFHFVLFFFEIDLIEGS